MTNELVVEKPTIDAKLLKRVLDVYKEPKLGIQEVILVVLTAVPEGMFATLKWINFVLFMAGIEISDSEVESNIRRMKSSKKRKGKSDIPATVSSFEIKDGDKDVIDIEQRLRGRVKRKVCINEYGLEQERAYLI